jgi:hypothetical protein
MGNRSKSTYTGQDKYFNIDTGASFSIPTINEVEFAEVLEVILDPIADEKETIGRIKFRYLFESGKDESVVSWAYPANSNLRILPVKHEIVPILELMNRFYYLSPLNYSNSINNNIAASISAAFIETSKIPDYTKNVGEGIPDKKDASDTTFRMGDYFEDKNKSIPTLKPHEGDFIIQGRFGNGIRFGSNHIDKTNLPQLKISLMDESDIKLKEESLDDDNCIWLTNDGKMDFTIKSIGIHKDNDISTDFSGKQIFIFSDRLVIQSKENEMMFFSNKGIHFACNMNFSIDSNLKVLTHSADNTEINSAKKITTYSEMETQILSLKTYIGKIDDENLVIGKKWKEMMLKFLQLMIDFNNKDLSHIHPTGTGPSGPPVDPSPYKAYGSGLSDIKSSVSANDQLSDDNFTTKTNR